MLIVQIVLRVRVRVKVTVRVTVRVTVILGPGRGSFGVPRILLHLFVRNTCIYTRTFSMIWGREPYGTRVSVMFPQVTISGLGVLCCTT